MKRTHIYREKRTHTYEIRCIVRQLLLCAQAVFCYIDSCYLNNTQHEQRNRALTLNMYLLVRHCLCSVNVCVHFLLSYFKQRRKIDELRKRQKKVIKCKPIRNFSCMDNRKCVKRTLRTIFFGHFCFVWIIDKLWNLREQMKFQMLCLVLWSY